MMLGGMISRTGRQHLKTVGEHEKKKTHSGNENERRKRNLEIGHDVDYRGPEPGESDDSVKLVDPGGRVDGVDRIIRSPFRGKCEKIGGTSHACNRPKATRFQPNAGFTFSPSNRVELSN